MRFRRGKDRGRPEFTRVFFATDVHGSDDCWGKFLNAASSYKADVLIMGGDITGKVVVPIVSRPDGGYEVSFQGTRRQIESDEELAALETVMRRTGSYPYRTDPDEIAALEQGENGHVEEIMLALMSERLQRWVRLADERLAGTDTKLFISCGNDDPYELDEILRGSETVHLHDNRVVRIDEHHEMIGLGYANQTPWQCPRDIPEPELAERLERLVPELSDVARAVFCIHVPPIDSQLDTCPKLDDSVYPPKVITDAAGQPVQFGAGSSAVREAIERHQPLASLHGHIHESRGITTIGRTQSFNPGSEYSDGVLRGVIVNLTADSVLSHQFTSG